MYASFLSIVSSTNQILSPLLRRRQLLLINPSTLYVCPGLTSISMITVLNEGSRRRRESCWSRRSSPRTRHHRSMPDKVCFSSAFLPSSRFFPPSYLNASDGGVYFGFSSRQSQTAETQKMRCSTYRCVDLLSCVSCCRPYSYRLASNCTTASWSTNTTSGRAVASHHSGSPTTTRTATAASNRTNGKWYSGRSYATGSPATSVCVSRE